MQAWFVLSLICLILALGVLVWRLAAPTAALPLGWSTLALAALGVIFLLAASYSPVGTKEVGVVTSFGKTAGHLGNGPHLIAPWDKVHEMDAAIQTDSFIDGDGIGNGCSGIPVRIANQQTGCASVSFQWRIRPTSVDELYQDYRSFAHVRDALVTRKLTAAVNEAFAHYNPLNAISSGTTTIAAAGRAETLSEIAANVTRIMKREVGARIEVLSTILPIVTFDQSTQDRINQLQQQVALTRIATQQLQTNQAQAKANAALAKSVNASPNVLVSRCLDSLEVMVKAHDPVPAGFSCWPGGGVTGVIAGATGGKG